MLSNLLGVKYGKDLVGVSAALLLICLFYREGVFFGKVFACEDTQLMFYTNASVLHHAPFSFWNELSGLGVPRLGDPESGVFSPFSVIFYVLPPDLAWRFFPPFMIFFTWLGYYLLCRQRELSPQASAFGAISFASMGAIVHHVQHPTVIQSLACWAYILLFWDRYCRTGLSRWSVACALSYTALVLTGTGQYLFFGSFLLVGWGLSGIWHRRREGKGWRRSLATLAALPVVAALLGSVLLLPVLEYTGHSQRTLLTTRAFYNFGRADLEDLTYGLCSEVALVREPSQPEATASFVPYRSTTGVSLLILLAAAYSLRRRERFWMLLGAALFMIAAFGEEYGVARLLHILPGGDMIRNPVRLLIPMGFVLSWLAAHGLQDFSAREPSKSKSITATLAFFWVGCVSFHLNAYQAPFGPKQEYAVPKVVLDAKQRIAVDPTCPPSWINMGIRVGKQQLTAWSPLHPRTYYAGMICARGADPRLEKNILLVPSLTYTPVTNTRHPLLRAFNLNTIIAVREGKAEHVPVDGLGPFFMVDQVVVMEQEEARWDWLRSFDWDPTDVALVSTPTELVTEEAAPSFEVIENEPEKQVLKTRGGGGLLVTAGLSYPGWAVTVDGEPREMLQVDGALRGVAVAPGEHEVVWTYRPTWLGLCKVLTGIGLLLLGLMGAFGKEPESTQGSSDA